MNRMDFTRKRGFVRRERTERIVKKTCFGLVIVFVEKRWNRNLVVK